MIKKILLVLLIVIVLFVLYVTMVNLNDFYGEYASQGNDSSYEMTINHGKIKIVDVGAGNPILKGTIIEIPGVEKCLLFCAFDSDFDGTLLNLDSKVSTCDFMSTKVCRKDKKSKKKGKKILHNIVIFNSGDNRVIFEEKDE